MTERFDGCLQIKSTSTLIKAIDRAADRQLSNRSEYVRRAVIDRLKADGLNHADVCESASR